MLIATTMWSSSPSAPKPPEPSQIAPGSPQQGVRTTIESGSTDPEVLTEEFNGTTMTVMVPPTPVYGPCPTTTTATR